MDESLATEKQFYKSYADTRFYQRCFRVSFNFEADFEVRLAANWKKKVQQSREAIGKHVQNGGDLGKILVVI